MQYEETPIKNSKGLSKQIKVNSLDKLTTTTIIWHLVKRHKFGLVSSYATVLTIHLLFPFAFDLLFSVVKGF